MSIRREAATDEHVLNVRTGLTTLKTKYGIHVDEYDYLDIAIDTLRDIRNYGTTSYYAIVQTDKEGNAPAPCNFNTIDAVTALKQGLKQFKDRVEYKMLNNYGNDSFFTARNISNELGWGEFRHGLTGVINREGYLSYQLKSGKTIMLGKEHANKTIVVAFTGISVDEEGYPLINRKQANALAIVAGKYFILKDTITGRGKASNLLEFFLSEAGRLVQAASISENITDNELEALMDAKVSFNRKSFGRPTKYSR